MDSESPRDAGMESLFPDGPRDAPSLAQMEAWAASSDPFEQAMFELWRGRSIVSSVSAARLSREKADALLRRLAEEPASTARFYRHVRDRWIADFKQASTAEQRAEAAELALDDLYAYLLAHDLIEMDADAKAAMDE